MRSRSPRPMTGPELHSGGRLGFTLIEILIVIVIISMLIALLVPVLGNIQQGAQVAKVKSEINQLSTAIVAFKNVYGIEPPSEITIAEAEDVWLARDRALIRRMWPQFEFDDGSDPMNRGVDRNGDGDKADVMNLTGGSALVFFLGGVIVGQDTDGDGTDDVFITAGFSKNPANPFFASSPVSPPTAAQPHVWLNSAAIPNAAASLSDSREGPFFEFSASRLRFVDDGQFRIASYLDTLENETGEGYGYIHNSDYKTEPSYRQNEAAKSYYNAKTYQIVSPGFDGVFGTGGVYEEDDSSHDGTADHISDGDKDNITNFAGGMLRP